MHGKGVPDKNLWSSSEITRRDHPAVRSEGNGGHLLAVLVEVALGVRRSIKDDPEAGDMIGNGAVQEEPHVVPCLVAFVAVDPVDGGPNVWRLRLVLRRLRVARWGFDLPSPRPGVEVLLALFVATLRRAILVVSGGTSLLALSLLSGTLGGLSPLGLPSCLLCPALVGEILIELGCEGWVHSACVLVLNGHVTAGLSEVRAPDEDGLVRATKSDDMLVLGREDDPGDVGAVAPALFRSGSFDGAGVAEQFDEAALLGSREHLARVGSGSDVDASVAEPWPDALDPVAEFAGASRPLDVTHRCWLNLAPLLNIHKDELVSLRHD